jgi:integrase
MPESLETQLLRADHEVPCPNKGENSNPPHQNTIGYWWNKARPGARCETIRLHDLRHFHASGLIASGCDVVTVRRTARARLLRHCSPTFSGGLTNQ